jgi:adenine-specific DNA-methyltransferase
VSATSTASSRAAEQPRRLAALSSRQKLIGAYYTPLPVAQTLADWVIDRSSQRVLDPSFGDGRMLQAAATSLRSCDVAPVGPRLYGIELDHQEGTRPPCLRGTRVPTVNLLPGDFFSHQPPDFPGQFDAIIGNPPYVRHHLLDEERRALAREQAAAAGIVLNDRADAWAYFCAHLLRFLAPHGRLALLLPGSVMNAEYALPILHALSERAGHAELVWVRSLLFNSVQERTVVLLIDGRRCEAGVEYSEVDNAGVLEQHLNGKPRRKYRKGSSLIADGEYSVEARFKTRLRWFLARRDAELWQEVDDLPEVMLLDQLASSQIGVVTGANRFFVRTLPEAVALEQPGVKNVPVVSRGAWLDGPRWTPACQLARADSPSRLLLIDRVAKPRKRLNALIKEASAAALDKRSHCEKRAKWYSLDEPHVPELFLPYMSGIVPRPTINLAGATSTNAVHHLDLRPTAANAPGFVAASWTSLYRLSAELVGRSYGGGVLKLELGETRRLRLPVLPGGAEHLKIIEAALAERGFCAAEEAADRLLLQEGLGLDRADVRRIARAANTMKRRRGQ